MKPPFIPPDEQPEADSPPRPMLPLDRRRLRTGHPPQAIPLYEGEPEEEWPDEDRSDAPRNPRQDLDPVLGYILAIALSVGLMPLPDHTRYIVLWTFIATMGGMAFLLGSSDQFKASDPGDLLWGIGFGLFTGGALALVGIDTLATISERLFNAGQTNNRLTDTWVLQATVFVMPLAETTFFRGAMQRVHPIPVTAILASIWSMLLFFPNLGLGETPAVGIVFGTALVLLNFLYSYVSFRNGVAASLLCQVCAGTCLLMLPRLLNGQVV